MSLVLSATLYKSSTSTPLSGSIEASHFGQLLKNFVRIVGNFRWTKLLVSNFRAFGPLVSVFVRAAVVACLNHKIFIDTSLQNMFYTKTNIFKKKS